MAFSLFNKPPAGKDKPAEARPKPELTPQHDARRPVAHGPASARELADAAKARVRTVPKQTAPQTAEERERDITLTGPPSLIDWTQGGAPSIQVAEANPGLCAVLENAALLFASGQPQQARQLLEQGVASDEDARLSPLAWLALFDLLQRAGDRAAFDQLALQYVVAFERSAPGWEDRCAVKERGTKTEAARPPASGYFALTGKLSAANAVQINNMLAATEKQQQVRLDLASLTGADDEGTRLLAEALAKLRKRQYVLALQHPEKIRKALEQTAVSKGREAGEGYWMLLLELLQWQNDRAVFEDRAVDFAVAFELSPPSWEPPPSPTTAARAPAADPLPVITAAQDALVWQGTMLGPNDPQLGKFTEFREGRNVIPIEMTALDRIDFVCAGALLNAIGRAESQRKTVQISGATPIIRALLLLIGISPRHFVKKAQ